MNGFFFCVCEASKINTHKKNRNSFSISNRRFIMHMTRHAFYALCSCERIKWVILLKLFIIAANRCTQNNVFLLICCLFEMTTFSAADFLALCYFGYSISSTDSTECRQRKRERECVISFYFNEMAYITKSKYCIILTMPGEFVARRMIDVCHSVRLKPIIYEQITNKKHSFLLCVSFLFVSFSCFIRLSVLFFFFSLLHCCTYVLTGTRLWIVRVRQRDACDRMAN